jgi:glycosyltransferase involved in cell wall biosynthesis
VEIVLGLNKEIKNLHVLITGKRRNYIINELTDKGIKFSYFEMLDFESLNELYNCLDLYIVASRYEGGPQAILECGITKTPIISTDVGIAKEILASESIFDMSNYAQAEPNIEIAYKNSQEISMLKMFPKYIKMFEDLIES